MQRLDRWGAAPAEGLPLIYTLCFLTRRDEVLLLHRRQPPNQGLWNGVGGRIEEVVSNLHVVLPAMLDGGVPAWHHFRYRSGEIVGYEARAVPQVILAAGLHAGGV